METPTKEQIMKLSEQNDENGMLYWYPKIKDLPIPQPKTEMIKLNASEEEMMKMCDGDFSVIEKQWDEIIGVAKKIGFPLFMRMDEFSNKQNWENTCFVKSEKDISKNLPNLVEFGFMADIMGLPMRAIVFREYIEMDSKFKAFSGNMPVNPERRYYIRDGKVEEHFPYWIENAVEQGTPKKLPDDWEQLMKKGVSFQEIEKLRYSTLPKNWREMAKEMNTETEEEVSLLTSYAQMVAEQFKGYWSVDFCRGKDGKWYLIDMALGDHSWHPIKRNF